MSQLLVKFSKLVFLGLLPLLLISSIGREPMPGKILLNSEYELKASGTLNHKLKGKISFETAIEKDEKGLYFSTLKLNLDSSEEEFQHTIQILISKEDEIGGLTAGNYEVNQINGFLHHFDGVFGVVNITKHGELPFFSTSGGIHISKIEKSLVSGNLDMTLSNANGERIRISGEFKAE